MSSAPEQTAATPLPPARGATPQHNRTPPSRSTAVSPATTGGYQIRERQPFMEREEVGRPLSSFEQRQSIDRLFYKSKMALEEKTREHEQYLSSMLGKLLHVSAKPPPPGIADRMYKERLKTKEESRAKLREKFLQPMPSVKVPSADIERSIGKLYYERPSKDEIAKKAEQRVYGEPQKGKHYSKGEIDGLTDRMFRKTLEDNKEKRRKLEEKLLFKSKKSVKKLSPEEVKASIERLGNKS